MFCYICNTKGILSDKDNECDIALEVNNKHITNTV